MNKIKRLAGETVLYGLGSIVPRFLNLLLVPLHTAVFKPEEYGVITTLFAYVGVLNIVFMFGMETAYFRFANKPGADEQKVFNITQSVVMGISLLLSVIFIIAAQPISVEMDLTGNASFIVGLVLLMFIDAIVAIPFARLRLQKKAIQFTILKLINIGVLVGLNVYFLMIDFDPTIGVGFVILANLIANACYILFFMRTLLAWRPDFDNTMVSSMLRYSFPIVLIGLAGMTNEMFSRITLKWWLPDNFYPGQTAAYALGVFGACYKFAVIMNLAIQAFRYAAEPFFFSQASDKKSPGLFAQINHYFIIVCCLILLGVSINMDIIKNFLRDPEYWTGLNIVPVLLLAYLFVGVYYNMTVWFKLTDKTYYGIIITVGGAVITIVANYFLIPVWGYMGSSIATLLCYFTMVLACYLLGQQHYPIPYKIKAGMAYIILTVIIIYSVNAIIISNQLLSISFHAVVICLYIAAIYFIERKDLKHWTG